MAILLKLSRYYNIYYLQILTTILPIFLSKYEYLTYKFTDYTENRGLYE